MEGFADSGGNMGGGGNYQGFANPQLLDQMTGTVGQNGVDASKMYMDFIKNPAGSDLFLKQLSGLLGSPQLQHSREAATTGLADQYRAAGNMSSGAFHNAAANQQGDFNAQDQSFAAQLLGQIFPQMTSALQGPQNLAMQLATLLKQRQPQTGVPGGVSGSPADRSMGGGTPTGPQAGFGGQATNSSYPGGPATSWAAQDEAYVGQQKALSDAILAQFDQQYGPMNQGTYMGAQNGNVISGTSNGSSPWDPNAPAAAPNPWSFYNDPAGQANAPAMDWASMYGNEG